MTENTFLDFYVWLSDIINIYIIPILVSIGLIVFLWGILKYVSSGDDEEKRNSGRNFMLYGVVGLFIMVSVWGLVAIINRTFGIGQGGAPSGIPIVPGKMDGDTTNPSNTTFLTTCSEFFPAGGFNPQRPTKYSEIVCLALGYIQASINVLIALSLVVFLYGVIKYVISKGGEEKERGKARGFMLYGIIALFVMISVWGLVAIINRTLGLGQGGYLEQEKMEVRAPN